MQLASNEKHPLSIKNQQGFSLGAELGALTLLALDMRSERTRSQVISPESWKGIYEWLDGILQRRKNQMAAVQHLLVMSSNPVAILISPCSEKLLGIFPGRHPFTKVIHPIDFRMPAPIVPRRSEPATSVMEIGE
jgi:hypothetical protein